MFFVLKYKKFEVHYFRLVVMGSRRFGGKWSAKSAGSILTKWSENLGCLAATGALLRELVDLAPRIELLRGSMRPTVGFAENMVL